MYVVRFSIMWVYLTEIKACEIRHCGGIYIFRPYQSVGVMTIIMMMTVVMVMRERVQGSY